MMKFEIDDTKMGEATKKKLVDFVGLFGMTVVKEPVEEKTSGFVDMRVVEPKAHEKFFYLYNNTVVGPSFWNIDYENDDYNNAMWSIGNVYNTKEQAEYALERMKVRAELERLSLDCWGDDVPYNLEKLYHIRLSKDLFEDHNISYVDAVACFDCVYDFVVFKTIEDCRKAIETVGADRIKKYLFNVWD